MKKIYRILLLGSILTLLAACSDDSLNSGVEDPSNNPTEEVEGEPLYTTIEGEARTRNVQFGENALVRVNTVWLGVFDLGNGNLVAQQKVNMGYTFLSANQTRQRVIRHKLPAPAAGNSSGDGYFIVAVLNFNGVQARWNDSPETLNDLEEMLTTKVDTWAKFNSIGIDTASAYYEAADEDSGHSNDAPVMAGFLYGAGYDPTGTSSTHAKVDQFKTGAVNFSPEYLKDGKTPLKNVLKITYDSDNERYVTENHILYLRRLIANFNVKIEAGANVEITDVQYKKYNEPNAVYIIERRMLDNSNNFPTVASESPNFADGAPAQGYKFDNYWNTNTVEEEKGKKWSFSYQHFANKHWGRNVLSKYSQREEVEYAIVNNESKPFFRALCQEKADGTLDQDDFNNNASYFVLKMHIIDKVRNRCANAEYIIHEGYTSDADGMESDVTSTLLRDFSCARNIDYTYNIRVEGIDNLFVNVNGKEGIYDSNVEGHRPDIQGTVWEFNYIGEKILDNKTGKTDFGYDHSEGKFKNYLSADKKTYENAITINSDNPNLAFRIYGYNSTEESDNKIEGYNYNFTESSFSNLEGMWPGPAGSGDKSFYFQDYNSILEDYMKRTEEESGEFWKEIKKQNEELGEWLEKQEGKAAIEGLLFNTFTFKVSSNSEKAAVHIKDVEEEVTITTDTDLKDENNNNNRIFTVKIPIDIDMSQPMDIVTLMRAINYLLRNNRGAEINGMSFDLIVSERQAQDQFITDNPMDYVRCFYFTDRNGNVDTTDGCTTAIKVYAAVQGIQGIDP